MVEDSAGVEEQIKQQAEIEALNEVLEKRVEARTSELAAANEELEAFSYSVSHDLSPPLRAVAGFTKILQDDHSTKLNDDGKRFLALVRKNTHQMGDLIDDLLAFSRLSRQEISALEVDIEAITQSAWDLLKQSWSGRTIEFKIHDLPRVKADPVLLKQVLVNLLSNAIKFTRDEEKAMIEVGLQESRNNEWVTFYVRDNGVGFNEKYARNLLGVFQRLHRAEEYEGTGVGLAIVQRIIHRHGGSVSATSKPNEGATFLFSLRRFVE